MLLVVLAGLSLVRTELVENLNSYCKREGVVFQIQGSSKHYALSNYLDLSKISSNTFWIEFFQGLTLTPAFEYSKQALFEIAQGSLIPADIFKLIMEPEFDKIHYLRYDDNLNKCFRGLFDSETGKTLEQQILENTIDLAEVCIHQSSKYSSEMGRYISFYFSSMSGVVGCAGLPDCNPIVYK